MANDKKTIYQELNSFLNLDGFGFNSPSKGYEDKKIIIKAETPEDIQRAALEKQTVGGETREGRFSGVLTWRLWRARRSEMKELKLGNCLARYTDGSLYMHCWAKLVL